MKNKVLVGIVIILTLISCGGKMQKEQKILSYKKITTLNSEGTIFLEVSLDEALERARKENKPVFINCSTTTCAPCRMMIKRVFTNGKIGEYINSNFIAVHMNMDEGYGIEVAEKYNIGIYPTYLILNADGSKRGEVIGADKEIPQFLEKIKQAADI